MKTLAFIIVLIFFFNVFYSCQKNTEKVVNPNIIFLLADDMRYDALGCAGNSIIKTPNLDKLAREGVRFNNAFVTTSICCMSRVSIFSGQYSEKHGIKDFVTPLSETAFANTYPMILKKNGYRVGFIGKYGIGEHHLGKVPSHFDYFYGTAEQPRYENKDEKGQYIHYTDIVNNKINEFLNSVSTQKPFCLQVSFKAPHVQDGDMRQFIYNPRFADLYVKDSIPLIETNSKADWDGFPDYFQNGNEARKRWEWRFSTPTKYQESVRSYYRLISGLDEVVGNIRHRLAKEGLEDNTIIIFFSDNGFFLGEHGMAGKWYAHEESIRVPLIIYNPKNKDKAGTVLPQFALNVDIAPTILDYAGAKIPDEMQGESLIPLMVANKNVVWRKDFYYSHMLTQFASLRPSQAIRTEQFKYIVYPHSEPFYEEFYDLNTDAKETKNLIHDANYMEQLSLIKTRFKELAAMSSK